jgi:hypothetical protein
VVGPMIREQVSRKCAWVMKARETRLFTFAHAMRLSNENHPPTSPRNTSKTLSSFDSPAVAAKRLPRVPSPQMAESSRASLKRAAGLHPPSVADKSPHRQTAIRIKPRPNEIDVAPTYLEEVISHSPAVAA